MQGFRGPRIDYAVGLAFGTGLLVLALVVGSVGLAFFGLFMVNGVLFIIRRAAWLDRAGWRESLVFIALLALYVRGGEYVGVEQRVSVGLLVGLLTVLLIWQVSSIGLSLRGSHG